MIRRADPLILATILFYIFFSFLQVLNLLEKNFGCVINSKGFKVLPPYLRVMQVENSSIPYEFLFNIHATQGDGISFETLSEILEAMREAKWSADNVVFGSGGSLLQKLDRDTQKCAFKCSWVEVNGESVSMTDTHASLLP